ncbi:MAG: fimbrillin family protein [Rikenellaceae bacterium]
MKRILFSVLALSVLAGCTKEELDLTNTGDYDGAVNFESTGIGAKVSGTSWQEDDKVGIYMGEGSFTSYLSENIEYKADQSGETTTFSAVTDSHTIYYPLTEEGQSATRVSFFGYYPFDATITDATAVKIDVTDQSKDLDLLVSDNISNVTVAETSRDLQFSHVMSKIVLKISYKTVIDNVIAETDNQFVKVGYLNTTATYNMATKAFIIDASTAVISMKLTAADYATDGYDLLAEAIVIPNTTSATYNVDLKLTTQIADTAKEDYSTSFTCVLNAGYQTVYNVAAGPTSAEITGPSIEGWGAVSDTLDPEPIDYINWDGTYPTSVADAKEILPLEEGAATITTIQQLAAMSYLINEVEADYVAGNFTLAQDLGLNNDESWVGASNFAGTFDGADFTISDVNFSASQALFYSTTSASTISNLTLKGASAATTFVGESSGEISNCKSYVDITYAYKSGGLDNGGICGTLNSRSTVINCINMGSITSAYKSPSGIACTVYGSVINCANYGTLTANGGSDNYYDQVAEIGYEFSSITVINNFFGMSSNFYCINGSSSNISNCYGVGLTYDDTANSSTETTVYTNDEMCTKLIAGATAYNVSASGTTADSWTILYGDENYPYPVMK